MGITPITTKKGYDYYPASDILLQKLLKQESYLKWKELVTNNNINIQIDSRLREYQKEGVRKIVSLKRCGVFDEQRLGKTPMMLSALKVLNPNKTLIIVPKSVQLNWKQECEKWYTEDVVCMTGEPNFRKLLYNKNYKVYIISYGLALKDKDLIKDIDCIVVDEAHRMRNFKGMRSQKSPKTVKAIMSLAYTTTYRFALTGTPAPNESENIYPILHFLYDKLFTSYYQFVDYYYNTKEVYVGKEKTITVIDSFKKDKQMELQQFLDNIAIQRKRKDYIKWIPKVDDVSIKLELSNKEKEWYKEISETFECAELDINCANLLSQMIALRKICAASEQKIEWIKSHIEDYPDEGVIIASEFTSFLKQLKEQIPNSKIIEGSVQALKRKQIEEDYNKGKFKILLANIQCIKEGMKLENCNTMIITDPSLTYTDNEQLEDRLLPTTEEKAITKDKQQIVRLILKDTIDEYIQQQLKNKASVVDIINNFKEYLSASRN